MLGALDMNQNKIINVSLAVDDKDALTMEKLK
jgi:hypothetical protein